MFVLFHTRTRDQKSLKIYGLVICTGNIILHIVICNQFKKWWTLVMGFNWFPNKYVKLDFIEFVRDPTKRYLDCINVF